MLKQGKTLTERCEMQRLLDIVFSGLALLVLFPFLVPLAVLLRFTGEGEVFYRQPRIGKSGQAFGLIKFATMVKDSPNLGAGTITVLGDPRVLPVGRLLRKTKLNEIPQLLNVLRGDMSVIGPRPQTKRCFDVFTDSSREAIKMVQPGLSGIGSIVFRNEEVMLSNSDIGHVKFYDSVIAPYKGELEEWYVKNQALTLYLSLISLTIWGVMFPASTLYKAVYPTLPGVPDNLKTFL
jgi:lipopolysaccharide/colanic/teichoic acid biosynthesis glycosyltransferase